MLYFSFIFELQLLFWRKSSRKFNIIINVFNCQIRNIHVDLIVKRNSWWTESQAEELIISSVNDESFLWTDPWVCGSRGRHRLKSGLLSFPEHHVNQLAASSRWPHPISPQHMVTSSISSQWDIATNWHSVLVLWLPGNTQDRLLTIKKIKTRVKCFMKSTSSQNALCSCSSCLSFAVRNDGFCQFWGAEPGLWHHTQSGTKSWV